MGAATTRHASTPRTPPDRALAQVAGKLRLKRRGRTVHVEDEQGREIAACNVDAGDAEIQRLCEALLSHGRALGRREAFTIVRTRLDAREGPK